MQVYTISILQPFFTIRTKHSRKVEIKDRAISGYQTKVQHATANLVEKTIKVLFQLSHKDIIYYGDIICRT